MVDLGRTIKNDSPEMRAYPSMAKTEGGEKKKEYRRITVPATILEGEKIGMDEEISIELKCIVKGVSKSDWDPDGSLDLEVRSGEVCDDEEGEEEEEEEEEEGKKKETLLGGE